jgi:hypothetical protein
MASNDAMSDDLTDVSGIGPKTAEKIRESGIESKEELLKAYRQNDPRVFGTPVRDGLNKRAIDGIRDELLDEGKEFDDPELGVTVTPENRKAVETIGQRTVGELSSIDTAKARDINEVSGSDTPLAKLADPVREGRLGSQGASGSLIGFAADAAANITDDPLTSGQLQDLNRIKALDTAETTDPSSTGFSSDFGDDVDQQFELDPLETARAIDIHEGRSEKAQRVDERRQAPRTDDISKWRSNPDHFDYPGVDTKRGLSGFFPDERVNRSLGRGGSYDSENRDDERLRRALGEVADADEEVQERALGQTVEITTGRYF